ncbi:zinc finger protein 235-like isoform X5 [Periplaneta americana]|uniref:zinc finger protein 235-like isoform X5 n=1 Tax=Periplaneta americana TaxID=6978 RepID=UPI0037E8C689
MMSDYSEEYVGQGHAFTSEVKFEQDPVPISSAVFKREPEEGQSDLHKLNEERRVEVTAEDEISIETIAATNDRNVSKDLDSLALEENETVCEILKNSRIGKPVRTREVETQLDTEFPKICLSTGEKLNSHLSKDVSKKPYKCDVSGKSFAQLGKLHRGLKPFKCDVCGKCFSLLCNLKTHNRTHTGEKPFKCDVCGKCYSNSYNLKVHELLHTGEKLFKEVFVMKVSRRPVI